MSDQPGAKHPHAWLGSSCTNRKRKLSEFAADLQTTVSPAHFLDELASSLSIPMHALDPKSIALAIGGLRSCHSPFCNLVQRHYGSQNYRAKATRRLQEVYLLIFVYS
jgi:hypothetical protein